MAATVSGSKTVTQASSPGLPASTLTTLFATAIENLTVAQYNQIGDALARVPGGGESARIGDLIR